MRDGRVQLSEKVEADFAQRRVQTLRKADESAL